jgi:hypothetical protein
MAGLTIFLKKYLAYSSRREVQNCFSQKKSIMMRISWICTLTILLLLAQHASGQRALASLGKTVRNRLSGKSSDAFESGEKQENNKAFFFRTYAAIMSTSTLIWIGSYVFLANKMTTHPTGDGE